MPAMGLKDPTQAAVEASMDALADRTRLADGVPTSLADLGFSRASVDGRYLACAPSTKAKCKYDCGGVNGSYHDARGWPVLNTSNFPDVGKMVAHAHALNLTAGWYTNNFQASACEAGWSKTQQLHSLHMRGEAEFVAAMAFDELKVDSGGSFNDMSEWAAVLNATGREIALENCHQGGELPNASWCPFQMWRTSGDPKVVGWQREMLDTAQLLPHARRGCWAYPGYAIFGAHATNKTLTDVRTSFGVHAIISSPLILSMDITPAGGQVDLYWPLLSNREAIAVNQQWAGSVGTLVRKWNPAHDNKSSPLFAWGVACNSSEASSAVWRVDSTSGDLRVRYGGEELCLERDGSVLGVRTCNASSPEQGFRLNTTSGGIEHVAPAHGRTAATEVCVDVWAESLKGPAPKLGPFVTTTQCDAGGSGTSRAGRRWNLTASGQLVSQMGAVAWSQGHSWATDPPTDVDGPCLVPQRGPPNMFGPLQLWSKPQPGGGAAVLVASIGSTWGNDNTRSSAATFALSEIPGLPQGVTRVRVRDIWNRSDLPDATGSVTTDEIAPGDSRFYLLSPAKP